MDYDVIIIGSGPAGYIAAVRAGQMGLKTALIEKGEIGGMCLRWGCVPVKAMMESARLLQRFREAERFGIRGVAPEALVFDWPAAVTRARNIGGRLAAGIRAVLEKSAVDLIRGEAVLVAPDAVRVENRRLTAGHLVVATGSRPERRPLPLPDERYLEVDGLWDLASPPPRVVVTGAGPNALEIAQLLRLIGREVALAWPGETLLPYFDPFFERYARRLLEQHGVRLLPGAEITGSDESGVTIGGESVPADVVINAHFRKAVLPPSEIPLETRGGFLVVDRFLRTNHETIFAVGDVNGRTMLAHAASAQGLRVVNHIAGVKENPDERLTPLNIFTSPEMSQVGKDEPAIQALGLDYRVDEFPLSANAKALAEGNGEGVVRLLSDRLYGEILGVQVIAPHATDLIAEAAAVMAMEGTVYDMVRIVHAHPTVSEVFMDAGFAAIDQAVHA